MVSIITPTYNHQGFLDECLDSVQSQIMSDWEQIVVDDGSQDQTLRIAMRRSERDRRVKVIHQPNKGIWRLKETYNTALSIARGEFVAILEGDDIWSPQTLDRLTTEMLSLPSDFAVVYGQAATIGIRSGLIIGDSKITEANYLRPESFSHQIYTPIASIPPQSSLIRREALDAIGGFKQPKSLPLVDRPTFLELSLRYKFRYIPEALSFWRQHDHNTTSVLSLEMAVGAIPWVMDFFLQNRDLEAHFEIPLMDAVKIHQKRVFWLASSMIQDALPIKKSEERNRITRDIVRRALPVLSKIQQTALLAERQCVGLQIDLRKPFHFFAG